MTLPTSVGDNTKLNPLVTGLSSLLLAWVVQLAMYVCVVGQKQDRVNTIRTSSY